MQTIVTFDINNIIVSVVAIVIAVASGFFMNWLGKKSENEKVEKVKSVFRILCSAAQSYLKDKDGDAKMHWVLQQAEANYGVKVTDETMQIAESIYRELKAAGNLFDE